MTAASTKLSVGLSSNDRMLGFLTGDVTVPGYELEIERARPSQVFWRALQDGHFDVTEMSLAAHTILAERGENPFLAIPVFTSRMFRHGAIFVAADSALTTPEQLAGKRIGMPEYQMTAAVWMRGFLADRHGVASDGVDWFTGGTNRPGRVERLELRVPPRYRITPIGNARTLNAMLLAGELDAVMSPEIPDGLADGSGRIRRLFAAPRAAEEAYFRDTSIFPIMHVVAIRRTVLEAHPDLAGALFSAFDMVRRTAASHLYDGDAVHVMLPWLIEELERTFAVMGRDFWPYGVSANAHVFEAFNRHLVDQGMIGAPVAMSDIFVPELLDT